MDTSVGLAVAWRSLREIPASACCEAVKKITVEDAQRNALFQHVVPSDRPVFALALLEHRRDSGADASRAQSCHTGPRNTTWTRAANSFHGFNAVIPVRSGWETA
jgi:hypothetical protein